VYARRSPQLLAASKPVRGVESGQQLHMRKKNFTIKACFLLREGFLAPTNAEVRINNNQTTTENSNWI